MMRDGRSIVALSLLALACGARPIPSDLLRERFETGEAREARARAPDLWAAASRARRAAELADESGRREVAEEHSTRARLLLDAAIAESRKLALEEARLSFEEREREAELAFVRDTERREEILAEVARADAARVATEQAAVMYEQAVVDEERRYRGRSDDRAALHRDAADVLARRARLLLAAAQAMEAPAADVARVEALIDEAESAREPEQKVELADRGVRGALALLGAVRSEQPGPTADERAALVEAAREAGLEVEQRDHGLVLRVADVFAGSASAPSAAGARKLLRVAAILQAHPHGAVQVVGYAPGGPSAAARRLAATRASRAAGLLTREGVGEPRLSSEGGVDAPDATVVEVVLVGYGPGQRQ
jgi:flagellar motor protein MotB